MKQSKNNIGNKFISNLSAKQSNIVNIWASTRETLSLVLHANNKGTDQHAYPHILSSSLVFTLRNLKYSNFWQAKVCILPSLCI